MDMRTFQVKRIALFIHIKSQIRLNHTWSIDHVVFPIHTTGTGIFYNALKLNGCIRSKSALILNPRNCRVTALPIGQNGRRSGLLLQIGWKQRVCNPRQAVFAQRNTGLIFSERFLVSAAIMICGPIVPIRIVTRLVVTINRVHMVYGLFREVFEVGVTGLEVADNHVQRNGY